MQAALGTQFAQLKVVMNVRFAIRCILKRSHFTYCAAERKPILRGVLRLRHRAKHDRTSGITATSEQRSAAPVDCLVHKSHVMKVACACYGGEGRAIGLAGA